MIETIVVNILTRFAAVLPSDVHLAFNCLHGRAVRSLLTLCRACLNVNTNTDLDVCVPWETQKDAESRGPDPSDILTCYIISLGYSIAPIKLRFSAGNHLSKFIFQMSGQGFDLANSDSVCPIFPSVVCSLLVGTLNGKTFISFFYYSSLFRFRGNNWTLTSAPADGELHRRCICRSVIASASAALLGRPVGCL